MANYKVVGIDIGGSHITAGIVDLESRNVTRETLIRAHVNSKSSAAAIIDVWATVIDKLFNDHPNAEKKIGIAMPGPFDYEDGISMIHDLDKFECLFGLNVKKLLAEKLKINKENILMMNDASCFLKGEVFGGVATDCNTVLGVTLGTGLGSARFHDGKIFAGDLYCSSFKNETDEDYLSRRWLLKRYSELTSNTVKNVKELTERISDDSRIASLFCEFGRNLGKVLSGYAQKYNCDTIVIGGNINNAWDLFADETKTILNQINRNISIKKAQLCEEAAMIGAASLWN